MNKRTTRLLMDGLIATALVVLWRAIGFEWQSTESLGVTLAKIGRASCRERV